MKENMKGLRYTLLEKKKKKTQDKRSKTIALTICLINHYKVCVYNINNFCRGIKR